jgi:hypothetical protein
MNGKRLVLWAAVVVSLAFAITWATRPSEQLVPAVAAPRMAVAPPTAGLDEVTPPAQAVPVEALVADTVDWNRRYRESTDFFTLTAEMAAAALEGDARAAWLTSRVLLDCKLEQANLKPYAHGSLADRVEARIATFKFVSEPRRAAYRRRVAQCERLFTDDPFAAFDLPADAREFQYWRAVARASGDPLAVVERATRTMMQYDAAEDSEVARRYREELLRDMRITVTSRDPQALLAIGGLLTNPSLVENPDGGFAWWAAVCQMGYDCSNANPDIGYGCVDAGTCDAGQTLLDTLQRDLGPQKYAAIYAAGQDILYKVANDDWDGLQQYLAIK